MRKEMMGEGSGATVATMDVLAQPGSAAVAPHRRLNYVDGLRAIAALDVVAGHVGLEVWWKSTPQGIAGVLTTLFTYGHQAVSIFIVLSGFSLMLPVARNDNHLP